MYSRRQLAEKAALSDADLVEVQRCRQDHNRLGFAYQLGFVRLLNRFPQQKPFEVIDELLVYTGVQLGLATALIEPYPEATTDDFRAPAAHRKTSSAPPFRGGGGGAPGAVRVR